MIGSPSPKGENGRGADGRFALGWRGGPGNPFAAKTAQLRAALLEAVSEDDIRAVITKLIEEARAGDLASIKELLDRCLGRPKETLAAELDVIAANAGAQALDLSQATETELESIRAIRRRLTALKGSSCR